MKNLIYFCFFTLFATCCKEPIIAPNPIESTPMEESGLNVLWQIPLGDDSPTPFFSIDCVLIDDGILFSANNVLKFVDQNGGSPIWNWNSFIPTANNKRISDHRIIDDKIIALCSSKDNYAVDLSTGQTIWEIEFEEGNAHISSFENLIFHTSTYGGAPQGDSTILKYCLAEEGDWKEIIKFNKVDDYEVRLKAPAAYIDNQGDTILIFKITQIILSHYGVRVDLYAYNMTKDSILWKKEDFDPAGEANHKPPLIDGDYIYHVGVKEVFCINKLTGETVWKWGFPNEPFGFFAVAYTIHNDKFIIPRSNGDLYAIDKLTGSVIWSIKNHDAGFSPDSWNLIDNKLYYGSGKLYIVDVEAGKTLYSFKSPNESSKYPQTSFRRAVAVDLENKKMYATDDYFLMCMELPE